MNLRIAKKIIKKYSSGWLVMYQKYDNSQNRWLYIGDGFIIPIRWNNKIIRKVMAWKFPSRL